MYSSTVIEPRMYATAIVNLLSPYYLFYQHRPSSFPIIVSGLCCLWPHVTPSSLTFLCTMIYQIWSYRSSSLCLLCTVRSALLYFSHSYLTFFLYFYLLSWNIFSLSAPLKSDIIAPLWSATFFSTCVHSTPIQSDLITSLRSIFQTLITPIIILYTCYSLHCTVLSDRIGLDQLSLAELTHLYYIFFSSGLPDLS